MTAPSSPSWWRRCWANRGPIAGVITAVLVVACPLLPAQAQIPCRAAQQGLQLVIKVAGDGSTSSSSSSSTSAPADGCESGKTRSLPHFCACVDGTWRDYFDRDAGCPEN